MDKTEDKYEIPQLSMTSLEDLVIAITQLKSLDGKVVVVPLKRVLTPEILNQLPVGVRSF